LKPWWSSRGFLCTLCAIVSFGRQKKGPLKAALRINAAVSTVVTDEIERGNAVVIAGRIKSSTAPTPIGAEPAYANVITLDVSRPGKPTDNAYAEIFNSTVWLECLGRHWFLDLDAREKIEEWRTEYNEVKPHSAIGDRTPISLIHRPQHDAEVANRPVARTRFSHLRTSSTLPSCAASAQGSQPGRA
jgi:Integrase core domain